MSYQPINPGIFVWCLLQGVMEVLNNKMM